MPFSKYWPRTAKFTCADCAHLVNYVGQDRCFRHPPEFVLLGLSETQTSIRPAVAGTDPACGEFYHQDERRGRA